MQRIQKLSHHEAQKIAAGEVVERPANVVKELLENALDAGATHIAIHVEDGGKKLLRVVDNGCGMSPEDARLSIVQHATSKITRIDDLASISTFGFRGEALSSMCAVANVTITTKEHDTELGTKLLVSNSVITEEESVACNHGTDLTVADLFDNVPVRKKFLRTRETELRTITQLFQAYCLDYTAVHFQLYSDNRLLHNCPATTNVQARASQLWGHKLGKQLIELSGSDDSINLSLSGTISNHHYYRYDRNNLFFFVNNRWIKNYKLAQAVLKGYNNVIPNGRFPAACIFIEIDHTLVDVNVHPRKEEVQFLHPVKVERAITKAVTAALETTVSQQLNRSVTFHQAPERVWQSFDSTPWRSAQDERAVNNEKELNSRSSLKTNNINPLDVNPFANELTSPQSQEQENQPLSVHRATSVEAEGVDWERSAQRAVERISEQPTQQESTVQHQAVDHTYQLVGYFNATYLLVEEQNGLLLVDQHAAHERILYEQFVTRFKNIPTIQLLFPETIQLSSSDLQRLEPHLALLNDHGIAIEPFGEDQLMVTATPVHLKNQSVSELIKQTVGWIHECQHLDPENLFKELTEKVRAQMACTAAVKAGDVLTLEQQQKLLKDLYTTPNRHSCPHGRPTTWSLPLDDIKRNFKRHYPGK